MNPATPEPLLPPGHPLLSVDQLRVEFRMEDRTVEAVKGISFQVRPGETLAVVGESGSGKSVTALSILRLVEHGGGRIVSGRLDFTRRDGTVLDLRSAEPALLRSVRGSEIAMIFQEPMTSLNPVFTIGEQVAESIRIHQGRSHSDALREALRMLDLVRIPNARQTLARHPHQLSGGMRQRVMIAMALACRPSLLIADEPTTALDVTIQAQILQLIRLLQKDLDMAVLLITHDMSVVAEAADRVIVMHQGLKVEEGDCLPLFRSPREPYTRALLAAVPTLGAMAGTQLPAKFALEGGAEAQAAYRPTQPGEVLLKVEALTTLFPIRSGILNRVTKCVHAVEGVSFALRAGETLALVGESGCGKSTMGRTILRLVDPESGTIHFAGANLTELNHWAMQPIRRQIQMIFQDPFASLDPRLTVGFSIAEPLFIHGLAGEREARERVAALLEKVGLPAGAADLYPHEFSGGQRQRIAIARALIMNPRVIIADEAVSALDVSVRAQIINLLLDLQSERVLSYLFISHDMAVVERVAHRVAVMYLGQIVELGSRSAIFENPQHPYTRRLMAAVLVADPARRNPNRELLSGEVPSPLRALHERVAAQPLEQIGPDHFVARHTPGLPA